MKGNVGNDPKHSEANAQATPKDDAQQPFSLTKKERRAIVRAGMGMALKFSLTVIGIFFVVVLLLRIFWLR